MESRESEDRQMTWWDDLTLREQYELYLEECTMLWVPALTFEEWLKN